MNLSHVSRLHAWVCSVRLSQFNITLAPNALSITIQSPIFLQRCCLIPLRSIMVSTTTVFPSSVERLPVEIIQAIMMSLDEAASLPSLVLTCRSFYHAFKDAESFIIKNIVADELGPHVLLEAITTFDLASKAATNRLILDVYVLHNSFPRNNFIPIIDLSRAVALSRFHFYVRYFTLEYISTTLSKCPIIFRAEKHILPPASQTEISRIQRAFYRFEMFRLLGFNGQARNEDRGSFLNLFAPWENNQLACVNHYFYTIVSPGISTHLLYSLRLLTTKHSTTSSSTMSRGVNAKSHPLIILLSLVSNIF